MISQQLQYLFLRNDHPSLFIVLSTFPCSRFFCLVFSVCSSSCSCFGHTVVYAISRQLVASKGDFEDGYVRGFRDAHKISSATMARRRLDEDFGGMKMDFHAGYIQGLRDAGLQGITQSMQHLAASKPSAAGGYSAGYMQGFRDGNSGIFGDRITTTLLRRLEEQYPNQDEFRQGYIEGFKDATKNKTSETVTSQDRADNEANRLRNYMAVFIDNQLPESAGYISNAEQLAQELEEFSTTSRRGTLRRHYTPGDYLKYSSDTEHAGTMESTTLRPYRRTLSASNLGRGLCKCTFAVAEGIVETLSSTLGRRNLSADRARSVRTNISQYNDSYSRRSHYRTKSDTGSTFGTIPRRFPSQTILQGIRPGPATARPLGSEKTEFRQRSELRETQSSKAGTCFHRIFSFFRSK
ncbi:unnamed protein product [Soboliphyme baturini]|uniref:Uncharacterized protein n=1 Tax=Soboliphyme baturini TaxID=241478 RepID=A0A183IEF1_9BILA|nr:unnamed protein product [Soboliphyme baturini]